jgi:hypothetical protein
MASAMPPPCKTTTSTYRSFTMISSGLNFFLGISVLLDAIKTYLKSEHFSG